MQGAWTEKQLIFRAIAATLEAGAAILEYYGKPLSVDYKADNSPLTQADQHAHRIIASALAPTLLPRLSEEADVPDYGERKKLTRYWLIDPLDGTKEFVNGKADFTVNIALIENGRSKAGVVFAPVNQALYWACEGKSYRIEGAKVPGVADLESLQTIAQKLPVISVPKGRMKVLCSRSHLNGATQAFIEGIERLFPVMEKVSRGSSMKFCSLAEGDADLYPRLGPTMEWDTAAAQAIAEGAGCQVLRLPDWDQLDYNKPDLHNPWFVAGSQGAIEATRGLVHS